MVLIASVFLFDVRISTIVALMAFAALALTRRSGTPLVAGCAWLVGFEAAYQATAIAVGHPVPHGMTLASYRHAAPAVLGLAAMPLVFARWYKARPSFVLLAIVGAIWAAWVAVGFPVNQHGAASISPLGEAFNETAKTLWALAYLVPLWLEGESARGGFRRRAAAGSRGG